MQFGGAALITIFRKLLARLLLVTLSEALHSPLQAFPKSTRSTANQLA